MSDEKMPEKLSELVKEKVLHCYQCGACVGSCPTARATSEYNPRKMMEKLILGEWLDVLSGKPIWLCTLCHTCYEVCPQGVGISHIIVQLRNIASEKGFAPNEFLESARQMVKTGWTSPVTPSVLRTRKELGLPELLPVDTDEVKKLLGLTKMQLTKEGN